MKRSAPVHGESRQEKQGAQRRQPSHGHGHAAADIIGAQHVHGNRFVNRALSIQRKCECGGTCDACRGLQRKAEGGASSPAAAAPGLSSYLSRPGGGHALDSASRVAAESTLGTDLGGVRVHDTPQSHHAARALHAQAMTVGSNIFFSAGRYQPQSPAGQRLLSHELAHVAQQRAGRAGTGLIDDPGLEREADVAAAGQALHPTSMARRGVQRSPEPGPDKKKDEKDEEEGKAGTAKPPDKAPELRVIDLLPPTLRPTLPPEETPSERVNRMLSEDLRKADAQKGITHQTKPSGAPPAAPEQKGSVSEQDLIAAARALLARCNRDQRALGDPRRKTTEAPGTTPQPPGGSDTGEELKTRIEACLDTPEGEAFTEKAKAYLLSRRGAPVTVSIVGALLTNFALTGKIAYIPPIPLGKGAELSLEVNGPVDQPEQVMLTLKVKSDSDIANWFWKGLKAVGGALATFGGWIWKGLTTFAGWIWTGVSWLARRIFEKIFGILARVVQWMLKLPFRVARLFKHLIEGVAAVRPWSLQFWTSLGRASTWGDFLKWLGTVAIDLIEIAGFGEVYETVMDLLKFNTRALDESERSSGAKVFGSTIPWHLVRLDEAAVIGPAFTDREYTSLHIINGWGGIAADTLIHELTHVWQYENAGAIYMPQALHAQATAGYDYGDLAGLQTARRAGQGIDGFNREQQAQIVQDFFQIARGQSPMMSAGTRTDQGLYAHFVKDVSSHSEAHLAALRI